MTFDKTWFIKYQKILLFFANTYIGRKILCIDGDKSAVGKRKIILILPNSITWQNSDQSYSTEFRVHDKFSKRLYYSLKPIWYLIHFWDILIANKWQPNWNLGYDTLTQYPGSTSANNPVDGYVARTGVNEAFGTLRAGAGTTAVIDDTSQVTPYLSDTATTNQFGQLLRGIYCFNTAALTANAIISAVTFSLYGVAKANQLGSPALHVAGATPASTTTLANSDYGNVQTTTFGNISYASFSTSAYNDISLNASGIANIDKIGISKFSTQLDWDINGSFTGTWTGLLSASYFTAYFSDNAGTTNDPKLVVTYVLATSGSGSVSPSSSSSMSISPSGSVSPSGSISPSGSASRSISPSGSISMSVSPSGSISPSGSTSMSISPSGSISRSVSPSGSISSSISPSGSISRSISPSGSASASVSPSGSISPSSSVSRSVSPSPSLGTAGYVLDYVLLPTPDSLERSFIQIKTDVIAIDGKHGRDLGITKEKYLLSWKTLTKTEIDNILTIVAKNTAVDFLVNETNLTIAVVSVIVKISSIEYSIPGSDYLGSMSIELEEVV